jgi:polyisoprenoid-binding protein YceI
MIAAKFRSWMLLLAATWFAAACASAGPAVTSQPSLPTATSVTATQPADSPVATAAPAGTGAAGSAGSQNGLIQYTLVQGKTTASYKVREQLADIAFPSDAIGKTNQVSGSIFLKPDGTIDSSVSKITVDLSSLQSDRRQRDNFLRRNVLQTDQYPQAIFVPRQVTGLPWPLPQSGAVSFQLTGDLTIRNVTKPVTWEVSGQIQGDQATGTATTTFTFEDFNLTQPRVPVVLSVEDHITLELDLTLQKAG